MRKFGTEVLDMSGQRGKGTSTKKDVEPYIINPDGSTQANPEADPDLIGSQAFHEEKGNGVVGSGAHDERNWSGGNVCREAGNRVAIRRD